MGACVNLREGDSACRDYDSVVYVICRDSNRQNMSGVMSMCNFVAEAVPGNMYLVLRINILL